MSALWPICYIGGAATEHRRVKANLVQRAEALVSNGESGKSGRIGKCSWSGGPGSERVACHTCRDASAKVPLCLRPRSRQSKRLESSRQTASSFMLVTEFMATLTKTAAEAVRDLSSSSNAERERIFDAFRRWGYLEADLDPLGFLKPQPHPELQMGGELARQARCFYCGTVGADFMHIADVERRRWIQERMESEPAPVDQEHVLDLLIRADLFELVLQQRYLGTKRFSLEGVTALLPLVDEILDAAAQRGAVELVMGMSHRGRLNVITHVARRAPEEVFAGFEDVDPRSVLGGGDVKYHMGATGEYVTRTRARIHIHLVSNPSPLDTVHQVTVGRTL